MIDWYSLIFNAIWILGLGFLTAGLSMAVYVKSQMNWRLERALKAPSCRRMIGLGLVFFCLGQTGGVATLWERILWIVLALVFGLQTWTVKEERNS